MSYLILVFYSCILFYFSLRKIEHLQQKNTLNKQSFIYNSKYYYAIYALLILIICILLFNLLYYTITPIVSSYLLKQKIVQIFPSSQNNLDLIYNKIINHYGNNLIHLDPKYSDLYTSYTYYQFLSNWMYWVLIILIYAYISYFIKSRLTLKFPARQKVEFWIKMILFSASVISIITTFSIIFSILIESIQFFNKVNVWDSIFGLKWSPQVALRDDQTGATGLFGMVPLLWGTFLISFIALLVSGPIGLISAIYLSQYSTPKIRKIVKPILEVLAGIPTVVYGFFAILVLSPFIKDIAMAFNISNVSSENALSAGLVMGMMIIPFISSLSDDVIQAVPQNIKDGALALGTTKYEMIMKIIIPTALPGIFGGFLLAISRAIGETMIVVMAAGLTAKLTANPLDSVTTVTVQIVTLLTGDQSFDSTKTLAAFALALVLFLITLMFNYIALKIVKKYKEQYE
ncbi:phosphate ABC transporter permease subunit PstC [Paraphotobacterium marinum]|uniref:Phosphate transport system permease protein n=2 Tax=Paraphotobacterium marinum TaxID=1755811 RepID=A0A220VFG4_9GAMM|nr:phosphate ABC transporter permease subunit PstC [Paraphotobacterium marinum]